MAEGKPRLRPAGEPANSLGLHRADYGGGPSTLCAGCGHDSVSAAIIEACWSAAVAPEAVAKMSGIGCSSKTPGYFLNRAHGFNAVHGRMPAVTTGAAVAGRDLLFLGVSGDGDSASIGCSHFAHGIRRGLDMVYIVENNGIYGLTKGQFSATADRGSVGLKGAVNTEVPIDPVLFALNMGAGFVARSFSGDKQHLVPLIRAALFYRGFALIDVISPCVSFNNHDGSTRSYHAARENIRMVNRLEPVDVAAESGDDLVLEGGDGCRLRVIPADHWNPVEFTPVFNGVQSSQEEGRFLTGLLYYRDPRARPGMHEYLNTVPTPLRHLHPADLCPGAEVLRDLNEEWR